MKLEDEVRSTWATDQSSGSSGACALVVEVAAPWVSSNLCVFRWFWIMSSAFPFLWMSCLMRFASSVASEGSFRRRRFSRSAFGGCCSHVWRKN
ncbi:unnamed protein product [Linum trigynum]|uniref:Uncharacterized protein n=1 Tax=Linum trigynum TaxID=586398 RepID=A0AAV2EY32_9ROSI